MKIMKSALLLSTSLILVPISFAQADSNTQNNAQQTTYGDNPNLLRVLAGKTQTAVQNTADKVGEATEKGIAKIKPSVSQTWNNTKEYTTEQAVIARDNTRQGIDTTVKKVKQTKENIVGQGGVPIERGSLSQTTSSQSSPQAMMPPRIQNAPPQYENVPAVMPQTTTMGNDSNLDLKLNNEGEPEIQRQSIPIQNTSTQESNTSQPQPKTTTDIPR